ncbi:Formamidopyrimidine-DNA glycosylase [Paenibacillus solanacearum]|uniref:Formamidopyrimidine-DNA glycosylase n=1 Tax=Paenibacillus solanacearum TaxID=2048548 RepID=A0A916K905_9BACL|nr:bifunctional DNA-formamidopyrimidine glycosylase/DNA-(apurinic or apyrimidinic site) lyase [Paenibacillus solanacearum]CAG7645537.1 Formamidopyrimidine-DNA glycosylase [Paenibacillus solanacearum]
MPELPEMENYRGLLVGRIVGRTITAVEIGREKSINVSPEQFCREVEGQAVSRVDRRAKHLLFHLTNRKVLVLHLMLGGMMVYGRMEDKPDRSIQVRLSFGEEHLFFIGLRLGYLHLHDETELASLFAKLGPEPFDPQLTPDRMAERLRHKNSTLKNSLVDQSVLAGIGNCYSDEICFQARLLPARRTSSLAEREIETLYASMKEVLSEAARYGGYMEMPLFKEDALTGGFDERCRVYDREGEPCERCGNPIARQEVSSKKSFCCLQCQQ